MYICENSIFCWFVSWPYFFLVGLVIFIENQTSCIKNSQGSRACDLPLGKTHPIFWKAVCAEANHLSPARYWLISGKIAVFISLCLSLIHVCYQVSASLGPCGAYSVHRLQILSSLQTLSLSFCFISTLVLPKPLLYFSIPFCPAPWLLAYGILTIIGGKPSEVQIHLSPRTWPLLFFLLGLFKLHIYVLWIHSKSPAGLIAFHPGLSSCFPSLSPTVNAHMMLVHLSVVPFLLDYLPFKCLLL